VDADHDRMRLLAQWVPREQAFGGRVRSGQVAGSEPSLGHDRQRILEPIGQPFALGREAVVTEALEEIAGVLADRGLGATARVRQARLELGDIECDLGVHADPERLGIDIEEAVGDDARVEEALAHEPQGLPQGPGRAGVGVGPQIRGDRLARAWPSSEDEQREQGLGVPAGQLDDTPVDRSSLESPEQGDPEPDSWFVRDGSHRRPVPLAAASDLPLEGRSATFARSGFPRSRPSVSPPPIRRPRIRSGPAMMLVAGRPRSRLADTIHVGKPTE
jgi:hypothetical protein